MRNFTKLITSIFMLISFLFFAPKSIYAQEQEAQYKGIVKKILENEIKEGENVEEIYQKLEIEIKNSDKKGETIIVENSYYGQLNQLKYKKNDKVIISANFEGGYYISDYDRVDSMAILFLLFVITAILVNRRRGFFSLLSMAISFFIIFQFILPSIVSGSDPVLIVVLFSLLLIPISFYLSHGFNKETHISILSSIISIIITGILANIFINSTNLTGQSNEEAMFLNTLGGVQYDLKKILLAGIIISMQGVLDDVTVAQAEVVKQLKIANKNLNWTELYAKSMNIGRTHIASMINTLVLVYSGASFTLLLLFINSSTAVTEVLNLEIIATEIVRTLVGSIGLMLAVPLTTFLASILSRSLKNN